MRKNIQNNGKYDEIMRMITIMKQDFRSGSHMNMTEMQTKNFYCEYQEYDLEGREYVPFRIKNVLEPGA